MGLGLKSMTGSRRVIDMLNRFGHSISYHTAEALETEIASDIVQRNSSTPDGILQTPGLCTGLAWDNYDENNETLSGSGTLHDTVGICYQNETADTSLEQRAVDTGISHRSSTQQSGKRKPLKRTFDSKEVNLEPYRKKPKISVFQYDIREITRPSHVTSIEYRDICWMACLAGGQTPMWAGWNSLLTKDSLPKQRISYMENINLPPTRLDVVAQTLKISQRVANECGDQYAVVHYDLAVAKIAMQMQAQESPQFDNIFVCFGPFHIESAYFGALGQILDGSGGPQILMETDVLAPGSLNGFLLGKHYNGCKRLHLLLAAAFQLLHFRSFIECSGIPDTLATKLAQLKEAPSPAAKEELEAANDYQKFMSDYSKFTELTLNGAHGSTARFWILYVQLVSLFLKFSRAYRTDDLELFVYALGQMLSIFFAGNRPNYSRWMVRYHLNLINADKTHPGVREVLENAVKRTNKSFSRTAVDMTLEQTINADAASRLTGIAAFSQSDSARRRWMVTRSQRSQIVGSLLSQAGLKPMEDITKSLKPYRIRKDNEDLNKLIDGIQKTMNPFNQEPDDNLYCLTTGTKVADDIKEDLLCCVEKGESWCKDFMDGCFRDHSRFEKPIPRRKVKNFASAAVKKKVGSKDMKLVELQGTRDLFGRLLYLSTVEKIDLEIVFKFPLSPVPLSLAHVDGSIHKTDKSKLLHKLESMVQSTPPVSIDATIVYAVFFLHTQQSLPRTYGGMARRMLSSLCGMSERVDLVCDTYITPSIKDAERTRRGLDDTVYNITGPDQVLPKDWQHALQASSFKTALFLFLASEWQCQEYADLLLGHQVYLAHGIECFRFTEANGKVISEQISSLSCTHEEADTRMVFHLVQIVRQDPATKVNVRANDTDVLVLLLYHLGRTVAGSHVWMDTGLSSRNTRRYISVSQLAASLDITVLDALPGLHAFTGSDYTAAFMNKGKARPLDVMLKSAVHANAFGKLGQDSVVTDNMVSCIERFVCALYGKPKYSHVDDVRLVLFQQNYAPKTHDDPLDRIKGVNPSSMPPCRSVLVNKIKRSNYVASLWKNAELSDPCILQPQGNGWYLANETYQILWYDGDQIPQSVCDVVLNSATNRQDDEVDEIAYGDNLYGSDESDDGGVYDD